MHDVIREKAGSRSHRRVVFIFYAIGILCVVGLPVLLYVAEAMRYKRGYEGAARDLETLRKSLVTSEDPVIAQAESVRLGQNINGVGKAIVGYAQRRRLYAGQLDGGSGDGSGFEEYEFRFGWVNRLTEPGRPYRVDRMEVHFGPTGTVIGIFVWSRDGPHQQKLTFSRGQMAKPD